jgi:pyruvate dehydrogenase E1 component alpha subunit
MKGHAEHDSQAYVPKEELEDWKRRDPIERYTRVLIESGAATAEELAAVDRAVAGELDRDVEFAQMSPFPAPESALKNVYAAGDAGLETAVMRRQI